MYVPLSTRDCILDKFARFDEKISDIKHSRIVIEDSESMKKKGISNQERNIVYTIDEHNHKVIQVSERERIHTRNLYEIYKDKISSQCIVVSDGLCSYHRLIKKQGIKWINIPAKKKEKNGYTLEYGQYTVFVY